MASEGVGDREKKDAKGLEIRVAGWGMGAFVPGRGGSGGLGGREEGGGTGREGMKVGNWKWGYETDGDKGIGKGEYAHPSGSGKGTNGRPRKYGKGHQTKGWRNSRTAGGIEGNPTVFPYDGKCGTQHQAASEIGHTRREDSRFIIGTGVGVFREPL